MRVSRIKNDICKFIIDNYKELVTGLLAIMVLCILNITISEVQYLSECRLNERIQDEKEITIAQMQIQTEELLNENGYRWDGTKIIQIEK